VLAKAEDGPRDLSKNGRARPFQKVRPSQGQARDIGVGSQGVTSYWTERGIAGASFQDEFDLS